MHSFTLYTVTEYVNGHTHAKLRYSDSRARAVIAVLLIWIYNAEFCLISLSDTAELNHKPKLLPNLKFLARAVAK